MPLWYNAQKNYHENHEGSHFTAEDIVIPIPVNRPAYGVSTIQKPVLVCSETKNFRLFVEQNLAKHAKTWT